MEVGTPALGMRRIKLIMHNFCREYKLPVFLCGDYEFLYKMYGLSGASGMESRCNGVRGK